MSYNSQRVPSFAAYGGVPQDAAYGGIPTEEAYRLAREKKEQNNTLLPDNISIQPNNYTQNSNSYKTESAWGYPNNTSSPFYNKMGRPYSIGRNPYKLWTLSGLYESNNGNVLWNNCNADKTGGCSYGTYQIETKKGTMKDYLRYLNHHDTYQPFYNSLQQVGGYDAALSGTDDFKSAWKELSKNKDFLQSQNDFIIDKKLTPTLRRISDIKGLDLDNRSPVIRDVLYSTATQHGDGGAAHVLHNRFGTNADISSLSDEEIIKQIYDERSDVNRYFNNSSENIKKNLKNKRFPNEKNRALELLKTYP